jgi:hypothetical protein
MNDALSKYRPAIVYVVCSLVVFGFAGLVKFLAGAFGLANSVAVRAIIGLAACYIWLFASRKVMELTTPYCDLCRSKPCRAPVCAMCGKYQEPVHADHSQQGMCRCNAKRQAA